jgi:hypothetical protein
MRLLDRRTLAFGVILFTACGKKYGPLPDIQYQPLPKQAPVRLDVSTLDAFVDWDATMPAAQVPEVQAQIALVKADTNVVDAVAGRLSFQNLGSYGKQLIYLSILGEMRNERALAPLHDYLYARDCPVFEERIALHLPPPGGPQESIFDACAGLKSAAVNMVSYLNSEAANRAVLNAVGDHPSRAVRISAINAYLFNHGDNDQAVAAVRQVTRPEEAMYIGMPRLTADANSAEFAARLERFFAANPGERAPQPVRVAHQPPHSGRPPRQSVTPSQGRAR